MNKITETPVNFFIYATGSNKMNTIAETPVRFIYATGSNGRKNTVAYIYDDANQSIRYGIAQCSEKDQFVKAHGRDAAFGRLATKGGNEVSYSKIGGSKYGQVAAYISANIDAITSQNFAPRIPRK